MSGSEKTLDRFTNIIAAIDRTRGNGNTVSLVELVDNYEAIALTRHGYDPRDASMTQLIVASHKEASRLSRVVRDPARTNRGLELFAPINALAVPNTVVRKHHRIFFDNYTVRVLLEEAINALRKVAQ